MLLDDLRMEERAGRIKLDYFNYSVQFPLATFLAGVTLNVNIGINADSAFVWRYTTYNAWSAAGVAVAVPDVTVAFVENAAGRNLQDQAIPLLSIAGTAQLPYILPEPKKFPGSTVVTVTATNVGAVPMLLYIVLGGFKVFDVVNYNR